MPFRWPGFDGMPVLVLLSCSLGLFCAAFSLGGVEPEAWHGSVAVFACAGLLAALSPRLPRPPALPRAVLYLGGAALGLVLVQLAPLPRGVLALLSPRREQLLAAAAAVVPVPAWAPLHAVPAAGFEALRNLACYLLLFLVMRQLAGHWRRNIWWCLAPLVLLATVEAGWGQWQVSRGEAVARGTFFDSDHFAGLLEMVLPLTVMWAVHLIAARRSMPAALSVCALLSASVLMLAAVVHALSRMGFLASLTGLGASGLAAILTLRRGRRLWIATVAAAVILAFLSLPGEALVRRYTALAHQPLAQDTRFQIWTGSLALIRDYPLLGCGLGAYASCSLRYKTAVPMLTVRHAHNDYLELAAEIGVPGCLLASSLGLAGLWSALAARCGPWRFAASGCFGSLVAMAGHSLVDFNLHVPANALVFTWVLALASSAPRKDFRGRPHEHAREKS